MGDQKINAPLPPVDWDLPDFSENADHPAKSFHDDHVGAKNKLEEAARQKATEDRGVVERPRDLLQKHTKIEESAPFHATQDDEVARRQRLLDKARGEQAKQSDAKPITRRAPREVPGQESEHLSKVEQRLWGVMEELHAMDEELAHLEAGTLPNAPLGGKPNAPNRQAYIEQRLLKMELQLRNQMQLLLAGGVGLTLLADPRLTFKRLFDRIGKWPRRVRPGRRPESDEDFDAFLSWVFEPPAVPEADQDEVSGW